MEPTYFYLFVLPLGVLIVILVSLVLYVAGKGDKHEKQQTKLILTYMRNRLKQEKIFAEELKKLQTLLDDKLIDQDTYVRLRDILEMSKMAKLVNEKEHLGFKARAHEKPS